MQGSFIANFEKKLIKFDKELRKLILLFFKRKNESTTYEIGNHLSRHSVEFMELKKYNRVKSWYRLRKTLESLEKEGMLKREMSGMDMKNLRFLNYRWIKITNKS